MTPDQNIKHLQQDIHRLVPKWLKLKDKQDALKLRELKLFNKIYETQAAIYLIKGLKK